MHVAEACAVPIDRLGVDGYLNEIRFTHATVVSWCHACVFTDGQVDDLTSPALAKANVIAMGSFDWVALVFATVVVALKIGAELKVSRTRPPASAAVRQPSMHSSRMVFLRVHGV